MNAFTICLILFVAVVVVSAVIYQIVTWNKPGKQIDLNAPMDDANVNEARMQHYRSSMGGNGNGFGGSM